MTSWRLRNRLLRLGWAGVTVLLGLATSACAPSELSTEELLAELQKRGVLVEDAKQARSQLEKEFDNLNDAVATGVPVPKLKKVVTLDGIKTDVFWCPGKREQAELVVARLVRGPRPGDPKYLDMATDMISGGYNVAFESHVLSMRPERSDDAAAIKVALTLARLADR